jgi:hypothetical protein
MAFLIRKGFCQVGRIQKDSNQKYLLQKHIISYWRYFCTCYYTLNAYQRFQVHPLIILFLMSCVHCYVTWAVIMVSLDRLKVWMILFLCSKCLGILCSNYSGCTLLSHIIMTVISLTATFSLQTFAIPGSISLSILSGFLFPFPLALTLVCFCSATGASLCYVLSYFLGRRLVYKYFPEKASQWALTVSKLTRIVSLTQKLNIQPIIRIPQNFIIHKFVVICIYIYNIKLKELLVPCKQLHSLAA